jgi:predicted metal-dependent hydrolase
VLCFHWKLLQLPVRLVDYVVVHELVHLVEPHHGRGFWERLERALPDWCERQDALAQQAREYVVF